MYYQASNAYSASITAGAILAVLFWNHAPRVGIAAWVVCYGIMIAVRHVLGVRFRAAPRRTQDAQRWLYYFATVVAISGILWGVYGAFLAQYADSYQLPVVLLALGALLSGAAIAYSASMSVYLAFAIPTMVPIALWLTLSPIDGKRFLGLMVFTWVAFMIFAARRFHRFALESLARQANLEELASQLKKLSSIDSLTNVINQHSFDEELEAALADTRREAAPLSVIVCDIDYFEHYNDAHGRMHGDVCLRNVAGQLDAAARSRGALVGRIGGERFAVLLRQSNVEAVRFAEELRELIERLCIAHSKSPSGFVTASFGVSSTDSNAPDLLQRAQAALQEAKRSGRNRVCADQPAATVNGIAPGTTRSEEPRSLKSAHV